MHGRHNPTRLQFLSLVSRRYPGVNTCTSDRCRFADEIPSDEDDLSVPFDLYPVGDSIPQLNSSHRRSQDPVVLVKNCIYYLPYLV